MNQPSPWNIALAVASALAIIGACSIPPQSQFTTTTPSRNTTDQGSAATEATLSAPPSAATSTIPAATVTSHPVDPRSSLAAGTYLVYWVSGHLRARTLDGSVDQELIPMGNEPYARLSPDGARVAFGSDGQLFIYDLFSGVLTPLHTAGTNSYTPDWSPDGTRLVFAFDSEPPVNSSIYQLDLATGGIVRLTPWDTVERSPAWSPDGHWIAYAADQAVIRSTGGSFLGVTELYLLNAVCISSVASCGGSSQRITFGAPETVADAPAWSPNSRSLAFMCGRAIGEDFEYDICTVGLDGSKFSALMTTPEEELWPVWSPDGAQIGYTRKDPDAPNRDIYVLPFDGGEPVNVTRSADVDEVLAFWLVIP